MKTTKSKIRCGGMLAIWVVALGLMVCTAELARAAPVGTAFTYQGRLIDANSAADGLYDFEFKLFDDPCTGTQQGGTIDINDLDVIEGYFTVVLDFGPDIFTGSARWLETTVAQSDGSDPCALTPRVELTPTPYALALPGLWTQQFATSTNLIGGYSGNSVTSGVVAATIGGGGDSTRPNKVTDNSGTVGGGVDNQAGDADGTTTDATYATVGGGLGNKASVEFATVGGGYDNTAGLRDSDPPPDDIYQIETCATVGGGQGNSARGPWSTIGGGLGNTASERVICGEAGCDYAYATTVAGGRYNTARHSDSTVGGGHGNTAGGWLSTVSGGGFNTASGAGATVPGGSDNEAKGDLSFAAGYRAKVETNHEGTFVWADSTHEDFTSTSINQFLIRASGGVGIGTNSPNEKLQISGNVKLTGTGNGVIFPDGTKQTTAGWLTLPYAGSTSTTDDAFSVTNTGEEGWGVHGKGSQGGHFEGSYRGVYCKATGSNGQAVYGYASGSNSTGVYSTGRKYDFYAAGPGEDYGSSSSIRWKSDVRSIDDPLGKIVRLRGVYFNWDEEHGGEHDVGMIAEEVGEVLPEIVQYEENGIDASGMDYSKLTPLLVEAVKELKIEVNELQRQNAEKDGVIDTLKQQNDKLEGRLAALESSIATIAVQLKGGGK